MIPGHAILQDSLARDLGAAWASANYERSQRDEYTSKLRFGLVALNAASMITVVNLSGALDSLPLGWVLTSATMFLIGTVAAGYSLLLHQVHLIELAGMTYTNAMRLERIVTLSKFPIDSPEYTELGVAMAEKQKDNDKLFSYSPGAFTGQGWASSSWLAGAVTIAIAKVLTLIPPISSWALPWMS